MNVITLNGYVAAVSLDEEAALFHGEVVNIRDVLTFQGRSLEELRQAFKDTLDDYAAWCIERGKTPERSYSGAVSLDLGPGLHRRAAVTAARAPLDVFLRDQIERAAVG